MGTLRSQPEAVTEHLVRGVALQAQVEAMHLENQMRLSLAPAPPSPHLRAGSPKGRVSSWRLPPVDCWVSSGSWKEVSDPFFFAGFWLLPFCGDPKLV